MAMKQCLTRKSPQVLNYLPIDGHTLGPVPPVLLLAAAAAASFACQCESAAGVQGAAGRDMHPDPAERLGATASPSANVATRCARGRKGVARVRDGGGQEFLEG